MALTDAQMAAANKCKEILGEHFEAALIIVSSELSDSTESQHCFYHGGWCMARGLADIGRDQLRTPTATVPEED
jgi:hypothetical protein